MLFILKQYLKTDVLDVFSFEGVIVVVKLYKFTYKDHELKQRSYFIQVLL